MLWEILKAGRTNNSDDLFTRLAARRVSVSKRGYIVLPHGTGAFNATAKGNNIIWEYNGERVQGNTCSFNVLRDNGTIRLAFDEALERLEIKNNNALKADLSDLGGKITSYLNLYNCKNITGDLADLGGKITSYLILDNCQNISGVYSGNVYPTGINLSYTGVSAEEMDQNLINLNENTSKKGTFTANGMSRTAASDDAIAGLISKGWTVTGLTKV